MARWQNRGVGTSRACAAFSRLLCLVALASCGVDIQPLMPTPILFSEGGTGPLSHVPPDERWTPRRVYYATDRARKGSRQEISYGNEPSDSVAMGLSVIRFGDRSLTWEELQRASAEMPRDAVIELEKDGIVETSVFPRGATPEVASTPRYAGWILEDIEQSIAAARDKDILVYVHGAKVNFYNGCAFAAQLDHFMGRDMTSVAFCWPTRQRITAYALGGDRDRAYTSAESLASLLELLADGTPARRIHVLCWSAGGRVTTEAIRLLRERNPEGTLESLRARLRLGAIYFAAADVPLDEFLPTMPTINGLVDRFVVSISSSDSALVAASRVMG